MSRKPDYNVGLMNKKSDEKNTKVGAAWVNPDGTIAVVLDCFVAVPQQTADKAILLSLFPIK